MKVLYVISEKPLSLSCQMKPKVNHYLSINQKMIDGKIPHEVPDNAFYHDAIRQKLIAVDHSEDGSKKWKAYIGEKNKASEAQEKALKEARIAKLKNVKVEQEKRGPKTRTEKFEKSKPAEQEAKE